MKYTKFPLLILTSFLFASCVDPNDLDKLERYAKDKLEKNIDDFSLIEMKGWWSNHYENQALLALTNTHVIDELLQAFPNLDEKWREKAPKELLSFLVKSHQINISLRSFFDANEEIVQNWGKCENQNNDFLELKDKIALHYISGLKIPKVSETYMISGQMDEGGSTSFFESITTSLGTLFNRDKAEKIKKKSKKIKKLFYQKLPTDARLEVIFKEACLAEGEESKPLLEAYLSLHEELSDKVKKQWSHYLSLKSLIGNHLLKNKIIEISNTDPQVNELVGRISVIDSLLKIEGMRQHLVSLHEDFISIKDIDSKERIEDFIIAYEKQLGLLPSSLEIDLGPIQEELTRIKEVIK